MGLRVFLLKQVGVWIDVGSRYENEKNNGAGYFVEHLAFKVSLGRPLSLPWPSPHPGSLSGRSLVGSASAVSARLLSPHRPLARPAGGPSPARPAWLWWSSHRRGQCSAWAPEGGTGPAIALAAQIGTEGLEFCGKGNEEEEEVWGGGLASCSLTDECRPLC